MAREAGALASQPMSPTPAPLPQRHAWLWAAVPASARRVRILGDDDLADAVALAGYELAAGGMGTADFTIVSLPSTGGSAIRHGPAESVAVAIDPADGAIWGGGLRRRLVRAFVLAPRNALVSRLRAQRLADDLRPREVVSTIPMSDRSRTIYGLGPRLMARGMVPTSAIVRASPEPSVVDAAVGEAGEALSTPLTATAMSVVESGKVLVQLSDGARSYMLRVAGGPSAEFIETSLRTLEALTAPDAPAAVADRVAAPIADGYVGRARFSLEPMLPGRHPHRLSARLVRDCVEFLAALHCHRPSEPTDAEAVLATLKPSLDRLAAVVGAERDFARLGELMATGLEGARLGWGHGDFWAHNLLVRAGGLVGVLDWDTARERVLPALDLWDLLTLTSRRTRVLGPGERFTRLIWPRVNRGAMPSTAGYLDAIDLRPRGETVAGLALAYWVTRAARSLTEVPARARHEPWVDANVRRPLTEVSSRLD